MSGSSRNSGPVRFALGHPRSSLCRSAILAAAFALSACSGSGGGGGGAVAPVALQLPPGVEQGFFRGGNVAGLQFNSGAQSGTTDANGAYICEEDQRISFSVGAVELGDTDCESIVHVAALTASAALTDPATLNIMRFLMLLDADENPANGVVISEPLRALAANWTQIDFAADDFASELTPILSDITSVEGRLPDLAESAAAFVFLDASLSCAYSGVFISFFEGELRGAGIGAALNVFREPVSSIDVGDFVLIRQDPRLPVFLAGVGELTREALPSVGDENFAAEFVSPDKLEGTWQNASTFQSTDRSGEFTIFRLGFHSGQYRFVGTVERSRVVATGQQLISRIEVTLDGDRLLGRAFDVLRGIRFVVTGSRIAGSNEFGIQVGNLGSATITLLTDANGEPVGLEGGWPRFEGNVLDAVACRLI